MSLAPHDLADLRARHVAFLADRLVSPAAEAEWQQNFAAVAADLLATPVRALADAEALAAALDAVLTSAAVAQAARPLGQLILPLILRELAAEPGKVGDHVPAATRPRIEALLARPAPFLDRALRELADQEAVQAVVRDVLYDGLKEFSEKVNPFIAEWGVPSLLKKMSLLGGAMTKGLESVRAEADRRMEPEIQRFLAGFTKKGLRRVVDGATGHGDTEVARALRKHMLAWALDQELSALARELDAEAIALGQAVTMDVTAAELDREARRAQRRRLLAEGLAAAGDRTVAEVLAALGVTFVPDWPALARATWPLARAALAGPAARAYLEALAGEFYDAEIRAAGG